MLDEKDNPPLGLTDRILMPSGQPALLPNHTISDATPIINLSDANISSAVWVAHMTFMMWSPLLNCYRNLWIESSKETTFLSIYLLVIDVMHLSPSI